MGCHKGESEIKKKDAKFECGKCGASVQKKGHACKPVKIKKDKKQKKAKPSDKQGD